MNAKPITGVTGVPASLFVHHLIQSIIYTIIIDAEVGCKYVTMSIVHCRNDNRVFSEQTRDFFGVCLYACFAIFDAKLKLHD